ncbi:MAG: hypothetical protein JNM00_08340 [Flavobacteriales bacterium]|nr:hypothetical protein [Flavobacteriales bacterium]
MCPLPTCDDVDCQLAPPAMSSFTCAPSPSDGEITEILFGAEPFTSAEIDDSELMLARIDNDAAADDSIVRLRVTGKLNAPELSEQRLEGGVKKQSATKNFSIEAEFYNDTTTNYNAIRKLMYCGKPLYIYFVMGGKIYGGEAETEDGINAFLNILPSSEGNGSYLKYTVQVGWEGNTMPSRDTYPLEGILS